MIIARKKIERLSERALARFTTQAQRAAGLRGQVNVVLAANRDVRVLNRRFRGKDTPTDVLSFPTLAAPEEHLVGDVVISADIARQNARRLGHSPASEVKILVLHGLLHLAGYDHEADRGQMARKEAHLRRKLRLPVSLTERVSKSRGRKQ